MFAVYILQSLKDGKYYIGCTENLIRRLEQHNTGKVVSTKYRTPLSLVYFENCKTLSDARKREVYLKSLKGGNEFRKILKNSRR